MPNKTKISIVIPVYNEESNIPQLIKRLNTILANINQQSVEVVFIDDHSTDNSFDLLSKSCQKNRALRCFRLSKNSGSHIAILAGLEQTQSDAAVFLAADLQDPPELIPKMIKKWQEGYRIVWATRKRRHGISLTSKLSAKMFYFLFNIFGETKLPPEGSDFALLDRLVIDALLKSAGANLSLGGEIANLGFEQTSIPYEKASRYSGKSKWSLKKKIKAFIDAFVMFSYTPLRLASYAGLFCSIAGFIYALVVVFLRIFTDKPVEGWASLMVAILLIGGMQMLMIGVIGEYLWRTLEETRKRPPYFIEKGTDR